jgi:hypothetical protein
MRFIFVLFAFMVFSQSSYGSSGAWGKPHPSWDHAEIREFTKGIDAALKQGGKTLLQQSWIGQWNVGSKSYNAKDKIRMEYRTKARFSHKNYTYGKDNTLQIYFWYYHTDMGALNKAQSLESYYQNIHVKSDSTASHKIANHEDLKLEGNSHLFVVESAYLKLKTKPRINNIAFFANGKWLVYIAGHGSKASVRSVLKVLYGALENTTSYVQDTPTNWQKNSGGNLMGIEEEKPGVGYADPSTQHQREYFKN